MVHPFQHWEYVLVATVLTCSIWMLPMARSNRSGTTRDVGLLLALTLLTACTPWLAPTLDLSFGIVPFLACLLTQTRVQGDPVRRAAVVALLLLAWLHCAFVLIISQEVTVAIVFPLSVMSGLFLGSRMRSRAIRKLGVQRSTYSAVSIIGPTGSGKTLLLAALYHSAQENGTGLKSFTCGKAVLEQLRRVSEEHKLPRPTERGGLEERKEIVELQWTHLTLKLTSFAGEDMLVDGMLNVQLLRDLHAGRDSTILAVLNPFTSDEGLAFMAIQDLASRLQFQGHNIRSAIAIASQTLFHRQVPAAQADSGNENWLGNLPPRARLASKFFRGGPDLFTVTPASASKTIIRPLREFAKSVCRVEQPVRHALGLLLQSVPTSALVLTHIDLLPLLPTVAAAGSNYFDAIEKQLFGGEYARERVFRASNLRIELRKDHDDSIYVDSITPTSAGQIMQHLLRHSTFSTLSTQGHRK